MDNDFSTTCTLAGCQKTVEQLTVRIADLEEKRANLKMLDNVVRRNDAMYHALLENNAGGIALTGSDRKIVRVIRGLTGVNPGDLTGVLIESLAVPEDRGKIVKAYERLLRRTVRTVTLELRVPCADGRLALFLATLTDMLDNPNVRCVVGSYVDLTNDKLGVSNKVNGVFAGYQ